jgi:hypothetical protein
LIYSRLPYRHTGHHGLIAQEVGLGAAYHLRGGGASALQKLALTYADQDVTLFLSSEELSRAEPARSVNFRRIRDIFRDFDRVTVLCFLRPQWRFLQSIYLEISKNRPPPRPPALVAEALETGLCQGLYLDYCAFMRRLELDFEAHEILCVDYEAISKAGDLNAALQALELDGLLHLLGPPRCVNPSPRPLPQWAANLLAEPYPARERHVSATAQILPENGCLLTRDEIAQLKQHFAHSNARLVACRRVVQPDFQLTDPDPRAGCVFREDIQIEHWLAIARACARQSEPLYLT